MAYKFLYNGMLFDAEPDPIDSFHTVRIQHPIYRDNFRSVPIEQGRLFDDSISNVDRMATEEDIVQMVRKISSFEGREGAKQTKHFSLRVMPRGI